MLLQTDTKDSKNQSTFTESYITKSLALQTDCR